ncbi:MAG TPA: ATP-grasp domain-containing protein [Stellaceae bacterium]|nr:ATP-grasp domain-containing protein [Stellaceae bacterium]
MTGSSNNERTILVVTASRWPHTAFVAARLRDVGFSVAAVCPRKGALRRTSGIARFYDYSRLRATQSILAAIDDCSPALVVPGDDEAAAALHELHARCRQSENTEAPGVCRLIEESLGPSASFSIVRSKLQIVQLAGECGVRVPRTREIGNVDELIEFTRAADFPFLLKQEDTSGGRGVVIVRSAEAAVSAYQNLQRRLKTDGLRDLAFRLDPISLIQSMWRQPPRIGAQSLIEGRPANRAVACWKGKVLAGITVVALETNPPGIGTATVVEAMDHPEIARAAGTLVAKLGLSGFCGFDFVLDRSGQAYLLELNARLTSACWIGTTAETDLCGAMFEAVTGTPRHIADRLSEKWPPFGREGQRLALFPQEWMRSKTSEHLYASYHRVPWHDPQLLAYLVSNTLKAEQRMQRSALVRIFERFMNRIERDEVRPLAKAGGDGNPSL